MEILLFGASGMVGQGALTACVADANVTRVTAVVRRPLGIAGGKVREVVCADLLRFAEVVGEIGRTDACLFCAGVSSVGMSEADYRRTTYDLTLAVAKVLVGISPAMRFLYVSGAGTDANGRQMWARVKGETENALLGLGFAGVAAFRPGYIQPMDGARSKVGWINAVYAVMGPFYGLVKGVAAKFATDTRTLGRAMLKAVGPGGVNGVVESAEINRLGR